MSDLNQCTFIGRLGKAPETRHSTSGEPICNFTIAVKSKTKTKESTEWVRLVAFGRLAEICGQYLDKGSQVMASGRLQSRKYKDKDGIERVSTEIVLQDMQMIGSPNRSSAPAVAQQADEELIPF